MIYISGTYHSDVIEWNHFPRYWPFVRGIHRSPVNSPHKGQWRGALMFYLIFAPINGWVNTEEAGDLRRHRAHYDVIVMILAKKNHEAFANSSRCFTESAHLYTILHHDDPATAFGLWTQITSPSVLKFIKHSFTPIQIDK